MSLTVIDLFSGLGGFSQAFVDRGHNVTRYDINPEFEEVPHTLIKDVLELSVRDLKGANVVVASPDCTFFTWANNNPDILGLEKSKEVTQHALNLVHAINPDYWIFENPPGRITEILGVPGVKTAWGYWGTDYLKPTWLWGKIPLLSWPMRYIEPEPKPTWNIETFKTHKFAYFCKRDSKIRSLIPYSFSEALCLAIEKGSPVQDLLLEVVE